MIVLKTKENKIAPSIPKEYLEWRKSNPSEIVYHKGMMVPTEPEQYRIWYENYNFIPEYAKYNSIEDYIQHSQKQLDVYSDLNKTVVSLKKVLRTSSDMEIIDKIKKIKEEVTTAQNKINKKGT